MEFQDIANQNIDDVSGGFDKLKHNIDTSASGKVANEGLPMDVGRVAEANAYDEGGYYVAAVEWKSPCYNCGGWGHMSKECLREEVRR
jgi:hypothetical protein